MSLYDHIDLRVTSLAKVRALYDALLPAMSIIIWKPRIGRSRFLD
jgi:hypothetical protein